MLQYSKISLQLHFNPRISFNNNNLNNNNLFQLLHNKDHCLQRHLRQQQRHLLIRTLTHTTVLNSLNQHSHHIHSQLSNNLLRITNLQDNNHLRNIDNLEMHQIISYLLRYLPNHNSKHLSVKSIILSRLLPPRMLF